MGKGPGLFFSESIFGFVFDLRTCDQYVLALCAASPKTSLLVILMKPHVIHNHIIHMSYMEDVLLGCPQDWPRNFQICYKGTTMQIIIKKKNMIDKIF